MMKWIDTFFNEWKWDESILERWEQIIKEVEYKRDASLEVIQSEVISLFAKLSHTLICLREQYNLPISHAL